MGIGLQLHGDQARMCTGLKHLESGMQITPFRFVGSTAMMKKLRTASSPFMDRDFDGSATSQASLHAGPEAEGAAQSDLGALKSRGPLLPLLPLPSKKFEVGLMFLSHSNPT